MINLLKLPFQYKIAQFMEQFFYTFGLKFIFQEKTRGFEHKTAIYFCISQNFTQKTLRFEKLALKYLKLCFNPLFMYPN